MDSYCIMVMNPESKKVWSVPYKTNPGFVSYHGSRIRTLKDSFQIGSHKSSQFSKIWLVFTNPMNPHESSRILTTIAQNESLKIWTCKSWILTNSDLRTRDSRFVLRIHFVDMFSKYLICRFNLWTINPKRFDLYQFGRICIHILQA